MRIFYLFTLLTGFGLMATNAFLGREFGSTRRRVEVPHSVRQTPGAWRTFLHNNGFRGGK